MSNINTQELFHTLTVNTAAPLVLSQNFARQTEKGGIINILDSRIKRIDLNHVSYQLSKNMLFTLTEMMALEYAPDIKVNAVAPGMILSPVEKNQINQKKQHHRTLLHSQGCLSDITDAVLFFLSSSFITGEVIYVDGGQNIKRISYERND